MRSVLLRIYVQIRLMAHALKDESGLDLVEYGLGMAVVGLGVISGVSTLATGVYNAAVALSSAVGSAIASGSIA